MSATRIAKHRAKKRQLRRSRKFPVNVLCECGSYYTAHFMDGTCPDGTRKFSAVVSEPMSVTHDRRSMRIDEEDE